MSLVIANNVGALNAQHNLTRSSNNLNKSIERLSSGFKVNRGADGPAALVISEKQRAQIAGLRQAIDNTEKAVSVVQTAEGALNEINSILVKVRALSLDSANAGVNDQDAFAANQAEISNALDTINRIANNTQFGEKKLLDGSADVTGTPSNSAALSFNNATAATQSGSYEVNVTQAAERAQLTGTQGANLGQNETLTINDVSVTLASGSTQQEVVDRINEFSSQTGVFAEIDGGGGSFHVAHQVVRSGACRGRTDGQGDCCRYKRSEGLRKLPHGSFRSALNAGCVGAAGGRLTPNGPLDAGRTCWSDQP
ncbi:MAG: flagellin hook IN motif-containing protein [Actinomycetota bacterium]